MHISGVPPVGSSVAQTRRPYAVSSEEFGLCGSAIAIVCGSSLVDAARSDEVWSRRELESARSVR